METGKKNSLRYLKCFFVENGKREKIIEAGIDYGNRLLGYWVSYQCVEPYSDGMAEISSKYFIQLFEKVIDKQLLKKYGGIK